MRRAAKTDHTQEAIVKALRGIGAAVEYIKKPVDLLVCYRHVLYLLEVKNRDGKDQLTKEQVEFIARWPGPVHVVYTPQEALKAVMGEAVLR